MFDSPEAYAENFSAIKIITRGLYKIIKDTNQPSDSKVGRMFSTVNDLQGLLLLDNMQEVDRIIRESGAKEGLLLYYRPAGGGIYVQKYNLITKQTH